MDYLEIKGQQMLRGQVQISGAKNAALPILASTLLAKNPVCLDNVPHVADVRALVELLEHLGSSAKWHTPNHLEISTNPMYCTKMSCTAPYEIVRKMRASILVLGPLLGRFGKCQVSLPGGCAIGARPVDLHLSALEKMGAEIAIDKGYIVAKAKGGLKGCDLIFDKITVTGTENILMAASMAKGQTRIINAAKEPEVVQLCAFLQAGGVKISGVGWGAPGAGCRSGGFKLSRHRHHPRSHRVRDLSMRRGDHQLPPNTHPCQRPPFRSCAGKIK
ncbi:hypothetical protein ASB1_13790 [Helicobacter heilmannii]|nr:hypothetical protein ASB1_13790 [Helicobacter heilmannii]